MLYTLRNPVAYRKGIIHVDDIQRGLRLCNELYNILCLISLIFNFYHICRVYWKGEDNVFPRAPDKTL